MKTIFINIVILLALSFTPPEKTTAYGIVRFGKGLTCEVGTDVCGLKAGSKEDHNAVLQYDAKTKELAFVLEKHRLSAREKDHLLYKFRKTGKMQYTFTQTTEIPSGLTKMLSIKEKAFIPKGSYPLVEKEGVFELQTRLIFVQKKK